MMRGCGSVGRSLASDTRGARFESSHWQTFRKKRDDASENFQSGSWFTTVKHEQLCFSIQNMKLVNC